jgi:hypothetical protein
MDSQEREPWEGVQDPHYPAPGLQFLRGIFEAIAIWVLLAGGASLVFGFKTFDWPGDFMIIIGFVGLLQIVYLLPIALFVAGSGNTARGAGMLLPWALVLLFVWWTCGKSR